MKKLIAISVMCALVTWAAFAETTVGGQVFVGAALLQGDNVKDSQPTTTAISNDQYNTSLKITFSEGNAGGRIRILGKNAGDGDAFDEWFAWWRPIPQLRIQFGANQDGDFGNAQISGWGFTGENKNNGGNQGALGEYGSGEFTNGGRDHAREVGWYPGTGGTPNLQFSIFPVEGLTINLWIPFSASQAPGFTLGKFELNVGYRIVDVGNITFSYQSDTGYVKADPENKWYGGNGVTSATPGVPRRAPNSPKVFASFYLTAIENMGVDLGLAYAFPFNNTDDKIVYNFPFEIGLGFRYQISPDFQFKLRASVSLGESEVTDGDESKKPTNISLNILPSYKIGTVTVFLYGGIGLQSVEEGTYETAGGIWANSGSDTVFSWFINPYLFIPTGGSVRFKVGFQIYSDGVGYPYYENKEQKYDNPVIKWSIPIGFYTYF